MPRDVRDIIASRIAVTEEFSELMPFLAGSPEERWTKIRAALEDIDDVHVGLFYQTVQDIQGNVPEGDRAPREDVVRALFRIAGRIRREFKKTG